MKPPHLHVGAILIFAYLWCGTEAVRRAARSVVQCDQESSVVAAFTHDASCLKHCEQTYVNTNRESRLMNKGLYQARLMHELVAESVGERVHLLHTLNQQQRHQNHRPQQQQPAQPECCCLFEAPWPRWVAQQAIGRELDQNIVNAHKPGDKRVCLPLVMGIGLGKRTRESYEIMCRHLKQRNPLTMLELMQFVEAAAYLNYMAPKHPAIMLVLRHEQVKSIQKQEAQELRRALFDHLLDDTYNRQLPELPGYQLDTGRLRLLAEAKRALPHALKSQVVYQAFAELAVSQVLMDVAAVSYRLQELNFNEFHVPAHLLAGDYDKYDTDLAAYFTLGAGVDCSSLARTKSRVHIYLGSLKSLLGPLREKGDYEHMSQKFQPLVDILHTQKVYENLLRVNCHGDEADRSG